MIDVSTPWEEMETLDPPAEGRPEPLGVDTNPAAKLEDWPTITSMVLAAACPQHR